MVLLTGCSTANSLTTQSGNYHLFTILIHMHILKAKKEIDVELKPNEEIVRYHWFSNGEDESILSSSISKHLLPVAREMGLFY